MDAYVGSLVYYIKGEIFYPVHSLSQLLSPLLSCDSFLYFLQQQLVLS